MNQNQAPAPLSNSQYFEDQQLKTSESIRKILSFKDFKGFKKVGDITDHYKFYNALGKGSFGEVMKAEHTKANVICAVKIIKKKAIEKHQILVDLMHNELKVLEETTHPNIMRIFELLEDRDCYYIVSELMQGGELYERIVQLRYFSEQNAAFVVYQILLALAYMHSENIVHRDIKPENILLESSDKNNLNIKITDFGFACFFKPGEGRKEVLGSPLYMAPEIIKEQPYDNRVDIWSMGVIAYILLSGRPPFKGKTKQEIFESVINDEMTFSHPIWDQVSQEAKDFIQLTLNKDWQKRPEAKDLLDHAWILKSVKKPDIMKQVQLDVAKNLKDFRNTTVFQSGVLSFIVNLKATSEELEELKQMFFKLDTSKDGKLSIEEIKDGMERIQGIFKGSRSEYQSLMNALDKDGNGVIDYQEFITAAIDKAALLNKQNLQSAFKMLDQDNSGMITIDELKNVFDTQGDKKDAGLWQEIMKECDKNNDNQISFEEFVEVMSDILKKQHLNYSNQ